MARLRHGTIAALDIGSTKVCCFIAQTGDDEAMTELLEDLELVLVQMVAVTGGSSTDETRIRSEMNLALNGLEENEVLSRIQAVIPAGSRRFGT